MGVTWSSKNVGRRIRVSRSTSPRVVPGAALAAPSWTAAGEGRTSPAPLPNLFRRRTLRWSDHRRALRALRHIWRT